MQLRIAAPALVLACLASDAFGQADIAALGKNRASASALQWEVRDAGHPALGPIRFAMLKTPVATAVGDRAVSSNVYVSCERNTGKIAIELANGTARDDPGGLKPRTLPRLTCNTLAAGKPSSELLDARWTVNELGDVMARGFWPSELRACASIAVSEDLVLPKGWSRNAARVTFEIPPYARELDDVFATCGEPSAYGAAPPSPPVASSPASSPKAAEAPWDVARVTSSGRTNVRARPSVAAPLVIRLDPGDVLLVQRNESVWWRVRSRPSARVPFEGYVRRDRITPP